MEEMDELDDMVDLDQQLLLPANWQNIADNVKQTEMPTDEEMTYFGNYAELLDGSELIRPNSECLKMKRKRILLRNLDRLPRKVSLDRHTQVIFDIFIRSMLKKAGGNLKTTRYWLKLNHPGYREKTGYYIFHQTYELADGLTLINTIAKHSQSNEELGLDETMELEMRIFESDKDHGKGQGGRIPDQIMRKFGLKTKNVLGDTHCLAKALVIGKAWSDMNSAADPNEKTLSANVYRSLIRADVTKGSRLSLQQEAAEKLLIEAGMDPKQKEHTLEDLEKLAAHLQNYRIRIWTLLRNVPAPTRDCDFNEKAKGFIPLFYNNEHYEFFIPSVRKNGCGYCFKCHAFTEKNHYKKCKALCRRCGREHCVPGRQDKYCDKCNIWFHSIGCYNAHRIPRSNTARPYCERYEKCQSCHEIHERNSYSHSEHECHKPRYCKLCHQKMSGRHECSFAEPTEANRKRMEKKQESWVMVIYDYESIVVKSAEYNGVDSFGVKHEPNFVCYRIICNKCMGRFCSSCGSEGYFSYKKRPGESGTVMERFSNFLRTDKRLKDAYVIAHNGGRYDHVFTLEQLAKDGPYPDPNFLTSGNTFISVDLKSRGEDNSLIFRDSVKYIPMKLDQLPGAFDLETKSKGYFPYLFNHKDNYNNLLTHLPAIEFYEPKLMSVKQKPEFEKWYEENKNTPFELHSQLLAYCRNDVQILVEALVKYMSICQNIFNGWNPIIQCPTLASYVLHVMVHEHIPDKTIGNIPENGHPGRNNSELALKYLLWLEHQNPELKIQHKLRRGGEYEADCGEKTVSVDGYDAQTNTVYEIHGCMWHGCDECYLDREAPCPRKPKSTMQALLDQTKDKDNLIRQAGYNLQIKWECEIKEELRKDHEMAEFFKNCRYTFHLRPREAMYGGRTQPFKSLAEACSEYSIEYHDYCSLYPYINIKGTEYPIKTPIRITEDFDPITDGPLPYRGLVYCTVLPPPGHLLPVLPYRIKGKLLFTLCRSCAESTGSRKCTHTKISERCLTGVWCTDELNLAIQEGYQLLQYHEVWHWKPEMWFRGGFFKSFMNPLLKMKHEASGWPRNDMTDEEKQKHVSDIREKDGVELEVEHIKKNPPLRSLAKIFLNSTWGKFAQVLLRKIFARLLSGGFFLMCSTSSSTPSFSRISETCFCFSSSVMSFLGHPEASCFIFRSGFMKLLKKPPRNHISGFQCQTS